MNVHQDMSNKKNTGLGERLPIAGEIDFKDVSESFASG
jgi:hypothetical protein